MIEQYLVTVGITTYNSNIDFLSKALDSAINQTYKNIEIIIVDDFSNNIDEIENLIKKKNDKRISFFKSTKNEGVASSLNKIIKFSKGNYFSWCPDDDYMDLLKIELQIKSIESSPNSISLCNHYQVLDFFKITRKIKHNIYLKFFGFFLYSVLLDRINGGSLMIPINILKKNKFDVSLKHIQDYDMWYRLFYDSNYVYVNKTLFFSRQHSGQVSVKDNIIAKKEISEYYLSFFKKNMHNLIHYYGKYTYLFITMFFKYRDINSVVDTYTKSTNIQIYISNFYDISKFSYLLIYLFKIFGSFFLYIKKFKNYLIYKLYLLGKT